MEDEKRDQIEVFLTRCDLHQMDRAILLEALTHRSFVFESNQKGIRDNERLEFLGDAIISFVVAEYLYIRYRKAKEGELSKLRARLVSRAMLSRRGKELELGELIHLGKGEEQTGGRERSSIVGAALEAVVGAIHLSCGMRLTKEFILTHIIKPGIRQIAKGDYFDYKSRLQELVQKEFQTIPEYQLIDESGPEHSKVFTIEVTINEKVYGRGQGQRKKLAENLAAKQAYNRIVPPDTPLPTDIQED